MKTRVQFQVNEEELEYLKTEAKHLRISLADFVRKRLFSVELKPLPKEKDDAR